MPASPSWSTWRRSGTAVLSKRGRRPFPILRGRRGDSETPLTLHIACDHDSTPSSLRAPHVVRRAAYRGGRIGPTDSREPARVGHAARRPYGYRRLLQPPRRAGAAPVRRAGPLGTYLAPGRRL